MASKTAGKKKPSASSGAPRSYSEVYKSSAANATPTATAPAKTNGAPAKPASASTKSNAANARNADAATMALKTSDDVDWRGEYGYVLADLRYLGIVTASLLVGIIVIGIFL